MTIIFALVVLSGAISLVSAIIALCAHFQEKELLTNICGGIACLSFSAFATLPAIATGLLDWQAYVIPAAFAAGGICFLVNARGQHNTQRS